MALNTKGLQTFRAGLRDAIDNGVAETAAQVKQTRDELVHVISGELLASGTVIQQGEGEWIVQEGDGLPDARALYEEYGTDKHGPHPHMTPAAERNRKNLPNNVSKRLKALESESTV
jgi:hypothetical protein